MLSEKIVAWEMYRELDPTMVFLSPEKLKEAFDHNYPGSIKHLEEVLQMCITILTHRIEASQL